MSEFSMPVPVFNAFCNIITYYLRRRRETVIQAMVDLRPDIIKNLYLETALGVEISENDIEELREKQKEGLFGREGIWNETWRYWLQGDTCELVNLRTGERFDWKAGHPNIFFTGELFFHLRWRIERHHDNPNIQIYTAWQEQAQVDLHLLLAYLAEQNVLRNRGQHEWALLPDRLS